MECQERCGEIKNRERTTKNCSMTYSQALEFLYQQLPMFQRVGGAALKKDLTNISRLCADLGDPQKHFRSVHIAGTNGKGSTAHSLAAILQSAGYKTGLYTSPHLKDFSERIRINGRPIDPKLVVKFVEGFKHFVEQVKPSFFEMTVAMAFQYFANEKVDIAIVEVGLGGRLDSTNIINPLLSLITNISMDHQQFLGNNLLDIANEKAGIIKEQVPIIVSDHQKEVDAVFEKQARILSAPIYFAQDHYNVHQVKDTFGGQLMEVSKNHKPYLEEVYFDLAGHYQKANLPGVFMAVDLLNQLGFSISEEAIRQGLRHIRTMTGLKGRWQTLAEKPLTICDTGHNVGAWNWILGQLKQTEYDQLIMVLGLVDDKDPQPVLELLPKEAFYYFCQAKVPRAMDADFSRQAALSVGLMGMTVPDVNVAITQARERAQLNDLVFIGGSSFVVAEIQNL